MRRRGPRAPLALIPAGGPSAGPLTGKAIRLRGRGIPEHEGGLAVVTGGRKGRDAMRRSRVPIAAHFGGYGDRPRFADVLPLARLLSDDFLSGTVDRVDVVYNHFVSTLVQKPTLDQILPVSPAEDTEGIPGHQDRKS